MIPAWSPDWVLNRDGIMVAEDMPPLPVRVRDPSGRNRRYAEAQIGTRTGVNKLGATVMSVVVSIAGREHCVPPDWVTSTDGMANVIAFPRRLP